MKSNRTWGIGAVVRYAPKIGDGSSEIEGPPVGSMVRVLTIRPGICRVRLINSVESPEWFVPWSSLESWTARSMPVKPK